MMDDEMRGDVLEDTFRLRDNKGGWVPISDVNFSGGLPVTPARIRSVAEQLRDDGLIQWLPYLERDDFRLNR